MPSPRKRGLRHWIGRLAEYSQAADESVECAAEVRTSAIPILLKGNWRLYPVEEMQIGGAVPKDYLVFGEIDDPKAPAFIAKRPRVYGPRECVTEHMIARIGRLLPLKVARSMLVRLPSSEADPDVRFLSRNFLTPGKTALKHGVELVADYVGASRTELNEVFNLGDPLAERRFYTLETVVSVLQWWGRTETEKQRLHESFGRMLAFDALIGAQDRHAENWGVIEHPGEPDAPRRFAPIYDTARGIFADHKEQKFLAVEARGSRDQHVRNYAERSRPVFGCADGPERVNHFELVRYAIRRFGPVLRGPISQIINAYRGPDTERMLQREFARLVSPLRLAYVMALLRVRHARLQAILRETRTP
jgi:hypothetical protein